MQEVVDLAGGTSMRVTVARWLTPNGKNLGKEGVHPDIVVEVPKTPAETPRPPVGAAWDWKPDVQLSAAVDVLLGKRKVK